MPEIVEAGGQAPPIVLPDQYEGIALCGSNPATIDAAPFNNPKWIIYACSPHNFEKRRLPRVDEWFEIHKPIADKTRQYAYLRHLEDLPHVWLRDGDVIQHFHGGHIYPDEVMEERFGPFWKTSSIAFMQCRAILECERLHAEGKMPDPKMAYFGIMQASPNEYTYQRPAIQNLAWEASRPDREAPVPRPRIKQIAHDITGLWNPPPEDF